MKLRRNDPEWPASHSEIWLLSRLKPCPYNVRLHTPADIDAIATCMEHFGVTIPVLVDESGTIIAGHARLEAAKLLGLEKIPVVVAKGWSGEEKDAYRLADNQLAARATWDLPNLSEQLRKLQAIGFELSLIGFDETTIQDLIGPPHTIGLSDPDAEIEPPEHAISKLGDVWRLGRHVVGCGDCTNAEIVGAVFRPIEKTRLKVMTTDPPYGTHYRPAWRGEADGRKAGRSLGEVPQ